MSARHTVVAVLVALFVLAPLSVGNAEQPGSSGSGTGVIVAVTGDVTVHSGGASRLAAEGLVLEAGDTLVIQVGGTCTGFTPHGESFSLEGPSELRLATSPNGGVVGRVSSWVRSQLAQWIGARHRQPLVTRSLLRHWDQAVSVPQPLIPAPDGRVRGSGSEFRWAAVPGVDAFTVLLVSETDEETERLVRGQSLRLDDLAPEQEYVWKVKAQAGEWAAESSWRSFRVMTADEEESLEAALEGLGDLEAGVLLLSSGLHEEAVARFDIAVSAGADGRSARLWRARAMADVGLYKDAYEDLMAAGGSE